MSTIDSTNRPVPPTNRTNNYNEVLFRGGNSTWQGQMGAWVRMATIGGNPTSISTTYSGVLTGLGGTAAYAEARGWGAATTSIDSAFSQWDAAGISPICGGASRPGGHNCPIFLRSASSNANHFDTTSHREVYVR